MLGQNTRYMYPVPYHCLMQVQYHAAHGTHIDIILAMIGTAGVPASGPSPMQRARAARGGPRAPGRAKFIFS